ncbi:MAG: hypothetical protein C4523_20475 [Myxococcales bacterium]|nr:MAG: hypothetical protein C4523_20475 [Myxococcales bacterium]
MDAFFDRFARIPILQKILAMVLICFLVAIAFYFMSYSPQKDEIERINNNIAQLEKNLEEKKQMVGDLAQYKRDVEKLNQDLQRALKLLPNKAEIPSLLQKISSLAQKAGLEIMSFQPTPEIPQDFYAKVPVQLKIRGTFSEVTNFFDAVSKLSRIVNISGIGMKLDLTGGKDAANKKLLTTQCTATTFRFIPQAADAAASEPPKPQGK